MGKGSGRARACAVQSFGFTLIAVNGTALLETEKLHSGYLYEYGCVPNNLV